jgi:hypothetical protein
VNIAPAVATVKPKAGVRSAAPCSDRACPARRSLSNQAALRALAAHRMISDGGTGPVDAGAQPVAAPTRPPGAGPVPADAGPRQDGGTPAPACPAETITMSGAQCGTRYGAVARYCYGAAASGWWFKESVTNGSGTQCQAGGINQQTTPFQNTGTCIVDDIFDTNGPPSGVSPCTHTTSQTVFAGPTRATVTQCRYDHTQVIAVGPTTPGHGTVTTNVGTASTSCNW